MGDLSPFIEDNERWRNAKRKVPWEDRREMIDEHFPNVRDADWNVVLRDDAIFGRLLRDILKIDQIEPERKGPRPSLDYDRGMQSWRELTGQDFSELPFAQAFRVLTRGHSTRVIARRTAISPTRVHRLLHGEDKPTIEDYRLIAGAYNKKPAFFAEYRAEYILSAMAARLEDQHEMTIAIYRKLVKA